MPPNNTILLLLLLFLPPLHYFTGYANAGSLDGDVAALSDFRQAADHAGALASWDLSTNPTPCAAWLGVTCAGGRVTRLVLEGLGLSGEAALPALARLDGLRVLSLKDNRFSGSIPDLSLLAGLKLLFLARNSLSGPIPPSLGALYRLYRLDLSFNNLSGVVPKELNRLDRLLTLRLDSNRLVGGIDGIVLPKLQHLNMSNNFLSGRIPAAMAEYPAEVFGGNAGLCGPPLPPCQNAAQQQNASAAANTSTAAPLAPPAAAMVASSPSAKPAGAATPGSGGKGKMSHAAVIAIVAGDFAVVGLVAGLLFCYFWPRLSGRRSTRRLREGEKIVYSSSPYGAAGVVAAGGGTFERGKMVFLEDLGSNGSSSGTKRFELEELLRASAEMLGKGGCGTAYKAVLDDGSVVAVKRLREATAAASSKKEFEHHMAVLGRLRHPNIVPLTAYYYARDEKLLVYEFMPNGSLFSLLHGNRGPGRTPLDWAARMRIASGAGRGLAYIHHASRRVSGTPKLAHGNIKSSNILLDKAGVARLADCGLAQLGSSPAAAAARSAGYRAPEAPPPPRPWASQKGDIYAFGVVLLELLTGRCPGSELTNDGVVVELPRWVQSVVREEWTAEVFDLELMKDKGIEEEMVAMLQLALSCASAAPDQRPKIGYVVKMMDEIRAGSEVSPSHESMDESSGVSDSPAVSEGGAVSQ